MWATLAVEAVESYKDLRFLFNAPKLQAVISYAKIVSVLMNFAKMKCWVDFGSQFLQG